MIFRETELRGAFIIEPGRLENERGFFARTFCQEEFKAHGLNPGVVQCNISFNKKKGTLRGMHYHVATHEEAKLVRCSQGAIYDVIVDLRPDSPTFKQWVAVELTADNRRMLYIPEGFAHGFQTLQDNTEVLYQMSEFYHPECAKGVRWDDPAFGIEWLADDRIISNRDKGWPLFDEEAHLCTSDRSMQSITQELKIHYAQKFAEFGATPKGVDWRRIEDVCLRYDRMLAVIDQNSLDTSKPITLLDVGCGYGELYWYAKEKQIDIQYVGIDVSENMIEYALVHIPEGRFYCGDILDFQTGDRFDYVICNGILTQKLSASIMEMDNYAHLLIKKMFLLCLEGIAFNVMTTKVNYFADNLYYRNPAELLSWCMSEITRHVKIDHAYPLFEYTIYLYREPQPKAL